MELFGPVRTRRFGMSLGINHLPPKACSYSCVYCQLGRTSFLSIEPADYSDAREIYSSVRARLAELESPPDNVTFVTTGEPCLDSKLGLAIDLIKLLGVKVAVISNASLLWRAEVRARLAQADTVSVKVDAVDEPAWRAVNRPHGRLRYEDLLEGVRRFAQTYRGQLFTETMLVRSINDAPEILQATADFIKELQPKKAYLALPLRAPAEEWVRPPTRAGVESARRIFSERLAQTEMLDDLPDSGLAGSDDPLGSLLETLKVHPLEQAEVLQYLQSNHLTEEQLSSLVTEGKLRALRYQGKTYYSANIP